VAPRSRRGAWMVIRLVRSLGSPLAFALAGALSVACGKSQDAPSGGPSASAGPSAGVAPPVDPARRAALLSAELRRASRDVLDADLSHRDVLVRRAATRALSRIADGRSAELLAKSLADEDDEVVTWSAYGLGFACREREAKVVKLLAVRAASLLGEREPATDKLVSGRDTDAGAALPKALAEPLVAIASALGRCATPEAERTLRAWLAAERSLAEQAALGLGSIAVRTGRLDDSTLVALLDAASRPKAPIESALYPFARLSAVGAPVRARLLEVAERALGAKGVARAFAVRALAVAGDEAAPVLARVVGASEFSEAERADAARALGRLGVAGQKPLEGALEALLSDPTTTSEPVLASARFGVVMTLLDALTPPLGKSAPLLARLSELPDRPAPASQRRIVALRCRAADLLAGRGSLSPKLLACDPDPNGRAGRFAFLRVLDRGPLRASGASSSLPTRKTRRCGSAPSSSSERTPKLRAARAFWRKRCRRRAPATSQRPRSSSRSIPTAPPPKPRRLRAHATPRTRVQQSRRAAGPRPHQSRLSHQPRRRPIPSWSAR
jgi:hypothetical protein